MLWRAATLPALASLLPLGFRSVQLVASDFLSVLPLARTLTLTLALALTLTLTLTQVLPASCLLAYVEVAAVFF